MGRHSPGANLEPRAEWTDKWPGHGAALSQHQMSVRGPQAWTSRDASSLTPLGSAATRQFQGSTKDQAAWSHTQGTQCLGRDPWCSRHPLPSPRSCRLQCLVAAWSSERDCPGVARSPGCLPPRFPSPESAAPPCGHLSPSALQWECPPMASASLGPTGQRGWMEELAQLGTALKQS